MIKWLDVRALEEQLTQIREAKVHVCLTLKTNESVDGKTKKNKYRYEVFWDLNPPWNKLYRKGVKENEKEAAESALDVIIEQIVGMASLAKLTISSNYKELEAIKNRMFVDFSGDRVFVEEFEKVADKTMNVPVRREVNETTIVVYTDGSEIENVKEGNKYSGYGVFWGFHPPWNKFNIGQVNPIPTVHLQENQASGRTSQTAEAFGVLAALIQASVLNIPLLEIRLDCDGPKQEINSLYFETSPSHKTHQIYRWIYKMIVESEIVMSVVHVDGHSMEIYSDEADRLAKAGSVLAINADADSYKLEKKEQRFFLNCIKLSKYLFGSTLPVLNNEETVYYKRIYHVIIRGIETSLEPYKFELTWFFGSKSYRMTESLPTFKKPWFENGRHILMGINMAIIIANRLGLLCLTLWVDNKKIVEDLDLSNKKKSSNCNSAIYRQINRLRHNFFILDVKYRPAASIKQYPNVVIVLIMLFWMLLCFLFRTRPRDNNQKWYRIRNCIRNSGLIELHSIADPNNKADQDSSVQDFMQKFEHVVHQQVKLESNWPKIDIVYSCGKTNPGRHMHIYKLLFKKIKEVLDNVLNKDYSFSTAIESHLLHDKENKKEWGVGQFRYIRKRNVIQHKNVSINTECGVCALRLHFDRCNEASSDKHYCLWVLERMSNINQLIDREEEEGGTDLAVWSVYNILRKIDTQRRTNRVNNSLAREVYQGLVKPRCLIIEVASDNKARIIDLIRKIDDMGVNVVTHYSNQLWADKREGSDNKHMELMVYQDAEPRELDSAEEDEVEEENQNEEEINWQTIANIAKRKKVPIHIFEIQGCQDLNMRIRGVRPEEDYLFIFLEDSRIYNQKTEEAFRLWEKRINFMGTEELFYEYSKTSTRLKMFPSNYLKTVNNTDRQCIIQWQDFFTNIASPVTVIWKFIKPDATKDERMTQVIRETFLPENRGKTCRLMFPKPSFEKANRAVYLRISLPKDDKGKIINLKIDRNIRPLILFAEDVRYAKGWYLKHFWTDQGKFNCRWQERRQQENELIEEAMEYQAISIVFVRMPYDPRTMFPTMTIRKCSNTEKNDHDNIVEKSFTFMDIAAVPKVVLLKNPHDANHCFVNSMLQCLDSVHFRSHDVGVPDAVTSEIHRILNRPKASVQQLRAIIGGDMIIGQHDPQLWLGEVASKCQAIHNLGSYSVKRSCSVCQSSHERREFGINGKNLDQHHATIKEILSAEETSFLALCEECKAQTMHQEQLIIPPENRFINVSLPLFRQDGTKTGFLLSEHPVTADIGGKQYNLTGMIEHCGDTMNSAHYTAYRLHPDFGFWKCDDMLIEQVAQVGKTKEIYVLMFERDSSN